MNRRMAPFARGSLESRTPELRHWSINALRPTPSFANVIAASDSRAAVTELEGVAERAQM
jgi:hypothetical protein